MPPLCERPHHSARVLLKLLATISDARDVNNALPK